MYDVLNYIISYDLIMIIIIHMLLFNNSYNYSNIKHAYRWYIVGGTTISIHHKRCLTYKLPKCHGLLYLNIYCSYRKT